VTGEPPPDDPRALWQSQPVEPLALSSEELRRRAGTFHRRIWLRNLSEYLASAFVVAVFGWQVVTAPSLAAKVGPALIVAGTAFIVYRLRTRGSSRPLPPEAVAGASSRFYRDQLERQRVLTSTVWRWYLGPLVPGLATMLIQAALARPEPARLIKLGVFAAVCALMFFVIGKANQMAARKLEQEIRALDGEG
jgi:hypothetical protein